MTASRLEHDNSGDTRPDDSMAGLAGFLQDGEVVMASLDLDLDQRLHFNRGRVVATNRRLLARAHGASEWSAWPYVDGLLLRHHDHAGVGSLELFQAGRRLD